MDGRRARHRIGRVLRAGILPALLVATACACPGAHPERCAAGEAAGNAPAAAPFDLATFAPGGLSANGPVRRYDTTTLYEKIDGKANVYLAAGFTGLQCRGYRVEGAPGADLEACIYRMTDPSAAFAVFSQQRPPGSAVTSGTADACETDGVTLLARGRDFVEIAGGPDAAARARLARAFVAVSKEAPFARPRAPFPAGGRVGDDVRLHRASAFGFARLSDVWETRYHLPGGEAAAFWSPRAGAAEAGELAAAYVQHLRDAGATALPGDAGWPGATVLDVYGSFEVVAVRGRALAGVHQADTLEAATNLARAFAAQPASPDE